MAETYDIIINKGAKFYLEMQQVEDDGVTPIPFINCTIECKIRESFKSSIVLHHLTEANGGIIRLSNTEGRFALLIEATNTNIVAEYGVYDVISKDVAYPTREIDRIVQGKVTYSNGVTI